MALTFKIQIRGIKKPPVWRRISIPESFTFYDLHRTIQTAFGWKGYFNSQDDEKKAELRAKYDFTKYQ